MFGFVVNIAPTTLRNPTDDAENTTTPGLPRPPLRCSSNPNEHDVTETVGYPSSVGALGGPTLGQLCG
jgi:hypothetical protein